MKKILLLISIFLFSYGATMAQTATTDPATAITQTGAILNATVNANGVGTYNVKFQYQVVGSTQGWTTEDASPATISGSTVVNPIFAATLLTPGTNYHFRIMLESQGFPPLTTYGLILPFTTVAGTVAPVATTGSATNATETDVDLDGVVNTHGLGTFDVKFYYRVSGVGGYLNVNADQSPISVTGSTNVTVSLSGLIAATTYDYAVYMTDNASNSAFGAVKQFTTRGVLTLPAGTTTQSSAILNGFGNAGGGNYSTGFGYKKVGDPNYYWWITATPSSISGNAGTSFSSNLTGLDAGTYYEYVAALFVNSVAVSQGATQTFITGTALAPSIATGTIENITPFAADINSNTVSSNGGSPLTGYGIYWGLTSSPANPKSEGTTDFSSYPATFNSGLSGASPATKYYIQAYATNSKGTTKGVVKSAYTEPSQVTAFDNISGLDPNDVTKLTLNFGTANPGNGHGVLIKVAKEGGSMTSPTDGTVYGGNTVFSHDDQIVYTGPHTGMVTITGLTGTDDYHFTIWEYAGTVADAGVDQGINYHTTFVRHIHTNTTEFPIELLSFTAKSKEDGVSIKWSTASETDNDFFEIERSTDAENFEAIASVPGAGYSNEVLNYSIIDNDELEGTVYYRLKQTDFNGAFTYSYVLPVHIGASNDLQISNIISTDNYISFIYNNNNGGNTQVQLLDMSGRIIKTQQVSGEGSQMVRMNMRGMSRGIYVLHLTLNDQTLVKKVVF